MQAGEKSIGVNSLDNFLFPLADMYITQGEYQYTYSHDGTYAMDFQGYENGQRVYNCPYYAPFDCHCVAIWGSTSPMVVWESDKEVNFVDGEVGYACIGFVHDDNVESFSVGDTRSQGDVIGHTGTYGVGTGDHVHIECKKGKYEGYYKNDYDIWQLKNASHLYDCMGINDTVITKDYYVNHQGVTITYPWESFPDSPVPPVVVTKRKRFKWVLYARKLRR